MKRPKVLVFSSLLPLPVDRGDRNRLFHTLRLLDHMADVRLVCLNRLWEPQLKPSAMSSYLACAVLPVSRQEIQWQVMRSILRGRPHTLFRFGSPRVCDFVLNQAHDFQPDICWLYQLSAFPLIPRLKPCRLILDLVDSPSYHANQACRTPGLSWRARGLNALLGRTLAFERDAVRQCDVTLVSSAKDLEHLNRCHQRPDKVVQLDNCVPSALLEGPLNAQGGDVSQILFVGNLAYPPNEAGVRLFARDALPLIRQSIPKAEFHVCGVRGERLAAELGGLPGVVFRGFVEDLAPLYGACAAAVVPIALATGTQYKLLEAMAGGAPVVASTCVTEAVGARHGDQLWVADSAQDVAQGVIALIRDRALAARLAAAARAFIAARYTWESQEQTLRHVLGIFS